MSTITIMSCRSFKYGLLKLAESPAEKRAARKLAAIYIDADDSCKSDCTEMLIGDLVTIRVMQDKN